MTDIDWLAVDMVCTGTPLRLTSDERLMAIRRLSERMLSVNEKPFGNKLTQEEIGRRLQCTSRTVLRYCAQIPTGVKRCCPVCREPMWIVDGVVERHPDRLFIECPMSGRRTRRGLAAVRPDLYLWLEEVVA